MQDVVDFNEYQLAALSVVATTRRSVLINPLMQSRLSLSTPPGREGLCEANVGHGQPCGLTMDTSYHQINLLPLFFSLKKNGRQYI
jgi:hypothetical protein